MHFQRSADPCSRSASWIESVHLPSTFSRWEWELKDGMRENEGINAGIAPEEEVSQKGAADVARVAGLFLRPSCLDYRRSGYFSACPRFLFVHRRIRPPHDLIHLLARDVRG